MNIAELIEIVKQKQQNRTLPVCGHTHGALVLGVPIVSSSIIPFDAIWFCYEEAE